MTGKRYSFNAEQMPASLQSHARKTGISRPYRTNANEPHGLQMQSLPPVKMICASLIEFYGFVPCRNAVCSRKSRSEDGFCWSCWNIYNPELAALTNKPPDLQMQSPPPLRMICESVIKYYGFVPCKNALCSRKSKSEDGFCWRCWNIYNPELAELVDASWITCASTHCNKKVNSEGEFCKRCCVTGTSALLNPTICKLCQSCFARRGSEFCRPCKQLEATPVISDECDWGWSDE